MSKRKSRRSTIGILITIALTIFPAIQIVLLILNGGLTYVLAIPFGAMEKSGVTEVTGVIVNVVLAIVGLLVFYFGEKTWIRIVSTFLIMFSGQMLVMFMTNEFTGGDNYFLGWLTVSGIPILTILTVELIRRYAKNRQFEEVG